MSQRRSAKFASLLAVGLERFRGILDGLHCRLRPFPADNIELFVLERVGPWVNILAVREDDKEKPWVGQLIEAYHSEPVREFVQTRFKGTYLPAW